MKIPAVENKFKLCYLPPDASYPKLPTKIKNEITYKRSLEKWQLDYQCEQALVYVGIGEAKCPTIGKWAVFVLAGSVIAALSGKYLVPTRPEPYCWGKDFEELIWEAFWPVCHKYSRKLDEEFLFSLMRVLYPFSHYAPPDRPYRESVLAGRWTDSVCDLAYVDRVNSSVGNLRLERLKKGKESLMALPPEVQESIVAVSWHMETMLTIVIDHIRKTYHW